VSDVYRLECVAPVSHHAEALGCVQRLRSLCSPLPCPRRTSAPCAPPGPVAVLTQPTSFPRSALAERHYERARGEMAGDQIAGQSSGITGANGGGGIAINSAVRHWFGRLKTTAPRTRKTQYIRARSRAAFRHKLHEELVTRNRSVNDPGAAPGTSRGAGGGVVHATVRCDRDCVRCQRAANNPALVPRRRRQVVATEALYDPCMSRYQSRSVPAGSRIEDAAGG
jgi:hypothetical protein